MVDKIKPLKLEDPSDGGDETDQFPTSMDPNEDYLDCRGVVIQNDSSTDENVRVSRTGNELTFHDGVSGSYTLGAVVSGGFDFNKIIWDNAGTIVYANDENAVTKL